MGEVQCATEECGVCSRHWRSAAADVKASANIEKVSR